MQNKIYGILAATLMSGAVIFGLSIPPKEAAPSLSPSAVHTACMTLMQEHVEVLRDRLMPTVETAEEWDILVSVILETWHVACFASFGVEDNRERDNEMPWEFPGQICELREPV